jgi:hypothetical protein
LGGRAAPRYAQGYLFSLALPEAELVKFLDTWYPRRAVTVDIINPTSSPEVT